MSKIAIITPLPPETTGIAEFSKRTFISHPLIDVFWKKSDHSFDLNEIFEKSIKNRYKHIIFTLGNSDHCLPTFSLLAKFRKFPGIHRKLSLHVHDPVLTNAAKKSYLRDYPAEDFFGFYKNRNGIRENISCIYRLYEYYNCTGLASLISEHKIHKIITHSRAAKQLVINDLSTKVDFINGFIDLFHPCFHSHEDDDQNGREFDIGVFGIMDNGGKMTNKVINVIENAKSQGLINSCVLCGYNAGEYAKQNKLEKLSYLHIIENPSHDEMFEIMKRTRTAIQPRAINTGESSGIIPMLFSANTHPIVSDVGSFSEYPDELVMKVKNDKFESMCIAHIKKLNESAFQSADRNKICKKYVDTHNPTEFVNKLIRDLDS